MPWFYAICEAFRDPAYDTVIACMGSQMGKTESFLNIAGHRFDDAPVPALIFTPTEKLTKSISEDRLMKLLRSVPSLWAALDKGQRNRTYEKYIRATRLGLGWASSAVELASHPAGLVLIDERDRMSNDIAGEGDPVILGKARTKNYPGGTVGVFSTPLIEGFSPTWALFEEGFMAMWAWRCTACGERFIPRLELLLWPQGASAHEALDDAWIVCPHCGTCLRDADKHRMNTLEAASWIYHAKRNADEPMKPLEPRDEPIRTNVASFWVSGLASPWVTFGQVASLLIAAEASGEDTKRQSVVNTYGGELYRVTGERPSWERVRECELPYEQLAAPWGVQMVTLGADVQKDRIYYVVRGWGFNQESWLLHHGFVAGSTDFDDVWLLLDRVLAMKFGAYPIHRAFIDSGYKPGSTWKRPDHQVYTYSRRHFGQVYPTKGRDVQARPLQPSSVDVHIAGGGVIKDGVQLWHVDTDYFKTAVYTRIEWPDDQVGGWHVYRGIDEDYCRQVTAEEVVPGAKRTWIAKGANHYLDCEVLAYAAAHSLHVEALAPLEVPDRIAPPPPPRQQRGSASLQRSSLGGR